ncbi:hypothetical protein B4118_0436 [Bacillus cereus]|nr:hypothetical protein B4118_0436 [Bacillus cereus]
MILFKEELSKDFLGNRSRNKIEEQLAKANCLLKKESNPGYLLTEFQETND